VGTTNNRQTQCALLLRLDSLACGTRAGGSWLVLATLDATELFGVGEDEVHVLIGNISLNAYARDAVAEDIRTLSKASIWPVIDLPSLRVTFIRQLICVRTCQYIP
jgi:hypothetical protein